MAFVSRDGMCHESSMGGSSLEAVGANVKNDQSNYNSIKIKISQLLMPPPMEMSHMPGLCNGCKSKSVN